MSHVSSMHIQSLKWIRKKEGQPIYEHSNGFVINRSGNKLVTTVAGHATSSVWPPIQHRKELQMLKKMSCLCFYPN